MGTYVPSPLPATLVDLPVELRDGATERASTTTAERTLSVVGRRHHGVSLQSQRRLLEGLLTERAAIAGVRLVPDSTTLALESLTACADPAFTNEVWVAVARVAGPVDA